MDPPRLPPSPTGLCDSSAPDPVGLGGSLPSLDQTDLTASRSHPRSPALVQLSQVIYVRGLLDHIIHLDGSGEDRRHAHRFITLTPKGPKSANSRRLILYQ